MDPMFKKRTRTSSMYLALLMNISSDPRDDNHLDSAAAAIIMAREALWNPPIARPTTCFRMITVPTQKTHVL
jgi:hypothetical protein